MYKTWNCTSRFSYINKRFPDLGAGYSNLDPILLKVFNHTTNKTLGMALETLGVSSGRRDKLAIMADLLNIMQEPHRLTHILYKSNMSYVQLVKYLDNLIEMGFAEKIKVPYRAFSITTNGKLFMDLVTGHSFDGSFSK